ncbi:MAG: Gfo/Idh/MocA family protein [Cellulomonas sp.]
MTLRVAVVGTGRFAREHVAVLARLADVRVTHVAGADLDRARELAALVPGALATTDLDAAVSDPDVDAVDICNATPGHARWTIAAGRAGKHVHVEKPAALSIADLDAMIAATEGNGTSLMVGQTVRFQPAVAALQRRLARGDIGDPRLLHVSWYTGHVWPEGWRGWQYDVSQSGGHPVHNGTHSLDLAVWLMGSRPVEVFTRGLRTWSPDTSIPDSFQMQLRFENDSLATLELCYALRQSGELVRRLVLAGTTGTLAHSTADDPGLSSAAHRAAPASIEGALGAQLAHWAAGVQAGTPFLVTTAQVRVVLRTALAAQRSLTTGRPVPIDHDQDEPLQVLADGSVR